MHTEKFGCLSNVSVRLLECSQNQLLFSGLRSHRSKEQGLGQVGLTEGATQFRKNLLERREGRHLIGQASVPERSQAGLFLCERGLQAFARFFTEFQFLANRGKEVVELHFLVDREIPEIVEISRFVSGWIGESNCLLGSNFVEGVHKNGPIFGNVGELCISAKNGPICEREKQRLIDRDIQLHVTVPGKRSGISEIKRVGVGAHARVLPVEGEDDARFLCDCGVDRLETRANFFERKRLAESEVNIFREAIIGKVAALQGGAPLERQNGPQIRFRQGV